MSNILLDKKLESSNKKLEKEIIKNKQIVIGTIKNMLINELDYDFISKVTGGNIDYIKNIEKSINS